MPKSTEEVQAKRGKKITTNGSASARPVPLPVAAVAAAAAYESQRCRRAETKQWHHATPAPSGQVASERCPVPHASVGGARGKNADSYPDTAAARYSAINRRAGLAGMLPRHAVWIGLVVVRMLTQYWLACTAFCPSTRLCLALGVKLPRMCTRSGARQHSHSMGAASLSSCSSGGCAP